MYMYIDVCIYVICMVNGSQPCDLRAALSVVYYMCTGHVLIGICPYTPPPGLWPPA